MIKRYSLEPYRAIVLPCLFPCGDPILIVRYRECICIFPSDQDCLRRQKQQRAYATMHWKALMTRLQFYLVLPTQGKLRILIGDSVS